MGIQGRTIFMGIWIQSPVVVVVVVVEVAVVVPIMIIICISMGMTMIPRKASITILMMPQAVQIH